VAFTPAGFSVVEVGPFTAGLEHDLGTDTELLLAPGLDPAADVAVGADGRLVYLAGTDGVVRISDRSSYPARIVGELRGLGRELTAVAVSPDGRTVLTGGADGLSRLFDPGRLEEYGGIGGTYRGVLDRDADRVVTGDLDGVTRVWDRRSGRLVAELGRRLSPDDLEDAIRDVALSPDGEQVAVAAGEVVRVYDATGEAVLDHHVAALSADAGAGPDERAARSVAFTPDGDQLIVAHGDGTVGRIGLATAAGEPLVDEPIAGGLLDVAVSPGGEVVAGAAADGSVRLWDLSTGQERQRLEGHRGTVYSVRFDAQGRRLVTAGADATARVWDVASGDELAVLDGHEGVVVRARFDPTGDRVVTGSVDGFARVFDVGTGELVAELAGDDLLGVTDVDFDADGTLLVVSRTASVVRCRACVTDDRLLEVAAERATRQPTEAERERYDL